MTNETTIYQYDVDDREEQKKLKKGFLGPCLTTKFCVILLANIFAAAVIAGIGTAIGISISTITPKNYGESCSSNSNCKTFSSYGLICTNGSCNCEDSAYYSNYNCLSKKTYGVSCSKDAECSDSFGLQCLSVNGSNICGCNSTTTQWWNGTNCVSLGSYNSTCNSTTQCKPNIGLSCSTTNNAGVCTCSSGYYWNNTACDTVKSYQGICIGNSSCKATQLLFCSQQGQSPGTCVCANLTYFDTTILICTSQKSFNSSCTNALQCRLDLGLSCDATSKCACSSNYYWSTASSICVITATINQTCNAQIPCDSTKQLTCQSSKCACASTDFWDGTTCSTKKSIGSSCTSTSQCKSSVGLQCNSTVCMCNYDNYWTSSACQTKGVNGSTCTNTIQCQDYNLLLCTGGLCLCPTYYYWDTTSLTCKLQLTINSACSYSVMCQTYRNLDCISGTCKCQTSDFWNGTYCLKGYQQTCSVTSECYTAGLLQCSGGICDCPLPQSSRMYWVPAYSNCQILPKNCKEIKASNPSASSGIFYLASSVGLLEAYCEMVINGGGYTFVPYSSLTASTTMLQDIYTDKTHILFRIISRSDDTIQPYIITTQISSLSSIPIGILENSYAGYSSPGNSGSYVFIGFVPASNVHTGLTMGFTANSQQITFTNCDGNPNSYFALYANLNPTSPSGYAVGSGIITTWKSKAIPHPLGTYMPKRYFYFAEIHQGGCGGYDQSDRWSDYYGVAFGLI